MNEKPFNNREAYLSQQMFLDNMKVFIKANPDCIPICAIFSNPDSMAVVPVLGTNEGMNLSKEAMKHCLNNLRRY